MNPDIDDDVALISNYYPDAMYDPFVQEQDTAVPDGQKPRRRRRRSKKEEEGVTQKRKLTEEQVIALERCFETEHKLESERKDRLAAELGLDPRQVAVWFQNRRVRWKSKKMEEEYSKLRSEQENTVVEKCRLETQVLKLQEQLGEAEKEIRRLSERDGFSSNSPSSSFSMEHMGPPFLGEFGMEGLDRVFRMPQYDYNYEYEYEYEYAGGGNEMEWKSIFN